MIKPLHAGLLSVFKSIPGKRATLLAIFIAFALTPKGLGQNHIICSDAGVFTITLNSAHQNGNSWVVLSGSGSFDEVTFVGNNVITTISNIGLGINEYRYVASPPAQSKNIIIERLEYPIIYTLTGPSAACGVVNFDLVLSGSQTGYDYTLYRNGVDPLSIPGEDFLPLTWTVTEPGTYTVQATAGACTELMDGTVTVLAGDIPASYDLLGNSFCENVDGEISLSSSESGVSYRLYRNGIDLNDPRAGNGGILYWTVNEAGIYEVIATHNISGCTADMNNTLSLDLWPVPTLYEISPEYLSYCAGTGPVPISINGSDIGVSYQLQNESGFVGLAEPGTGLPIVWPNIDVTGRYSVIATDANNCEVLMIFYSNITKINIYSLSAENSINYYCEGEGGVNLVLEPTSQISVNYKLYKTPADLIGEKAGTGSKLTWENIPEGEYYVVAEKDLASCTMTNNITVEKRIFAGSITSGVPAPFCRGGSVQLTADGGTSYSWLPTAGLSNATISNPVASPDFTTTYTVSITDASGCSGTDDVTVQVYQPPFADAGLNQTICQGVPVQLNANHDVLYTYSWTANVGANPAAVFNPWVTPSETTTYTLTVTDANFCEETDQVTVTVNTAPSVNAGADKTICTGETATLTVTGNANSYLWSTGATTTSIDVSPAGTQTYSVTGTNTTTNCQTTDNVDVIVNPLPVKYGVTGGDSYCAGVPIIIGLTGSEAAVTYDLLRDNVLVETVLAVGGAFSFAPVTLAGTYSVRATSGGCSTSMLNDAVVNVTQVPQQYQLSASSDYYCTGGAGVTLTLEGSQTGVSYTLFLDGVVESTRAGNGDPIQWTGHG
jgi:hypothetical protein